MSEKRYIQIDDEGFFLSQGARITDTAFGNSLLKNLKIDESGKLVTESEGHLVIVEAFDEPLIVKQIHKKEGLVWDILMPYEFTEQFDLKSLSLDEWDRFHGYTSKGVPFVFSRSAQADFFNLLDEFDDTSITIDGEKIETPDWLIENPNVNTTDFWCDKYTSKKPGWELDAPSPALPDVLPQLKIPKSRVLILGAGSGNDAAFFANQGHIVTAVDMSPEAAKQAKAKYGDKFQWIQSDIFHLGDEHYGNYDLIFEHTCYCAITPNRRNELVKKWKQLLAPHGHLLGVFFVMDKRQGPPFGGSEWEIRERLKKDFDFLYWTRWKKSASNRGGKELVVYAKKKEG